MHHAPDLRDSLSGLVRCALPWLIAGSLAACATPPPQCAPAPPPPAAALATPIMAAGPSAGERQLETARERYAAGDYAGAIDRLHVSADLWADDARVRGEGYKLLAFSYCLTQRKAACRQAFESLLKLDPDFELKPTESGHPMWGPVFRKVRADLRP